MSRQHNTTQHNYVLKQERKKAKGRIQRTFDIPLADPAYDELLAKEADLLRLERYAGWSKADLCRRAWSEYVSHHHPGNPTVPLTTWTKGEPLSEAAQEKLRPPASKDLFDLQCRRCRRFFQTSEDTELCPQCVEAPS